MTCIVTIIGQIRSLYRQGRGGVDGHFITGLCDRRDFGDGRGGLAWPAWAGLGRATRTTLELTAPFCAVRFSFAKVCRLCLFCFLGLTHLSV